MANAVRSRSHARQTSTNDGNARARELCIGFRRVGREERGDDKLEELVEEEDGV